MPRNERGFALLVTLWLIVALSVLAGAAIAAARVGSMAAQNRLVLRRAGWAREACLAIMQADSTVATLQRGLDSVDLGNRVWCRLQAVPNGTRLNINLATIDQLRSLLGNDTLADAVLDWRDDDDISRTAGAEREWYLARGLGVPRNAPLASVEELSLMRGFTDRIVASARAFFTTRGDGRVSLDVASLPVVATLPGMTPVVLDAISRARFAGKAVRTPEQLMSLLAPEERSVIMAHYADLIAATATSPEYSVYVEGAVGASSPHASAKVSVIRLPDRLAIVARE